MLLTSPVSLKNIQDKILTVLNSEILNLQNVPLDEVCNALIYYEYLDESSICASLPSFVLL